MSMKSSDSYEMTNDVKSQIKFIEELDKIEDTLKSFVGAKSIQQMQKVEPLFLSKKKNYDVLNRKIFIKANTERYEYSFPKLANHVAYEKILELKRLKDEEEQKKKDEIKRVKLERNLMMIEDLNVLPKEDDEEAVETDEEDEISSY